MATDWIDTWLSEARFQRYLDRVGGGRSDALALYEWNASLSVGFFKDLGHFEVALRNAYHRAFVHHSRWGADWVFYGNAVFPPHMRQGADLNQKTRELLDKAIEEVGGDPTAPGSAAPGSVIAELSLGFWYYMTRGANQQLWIDVLHHSVASGTQRKKLHNQVKWLYDLRNRIAHHEHVYDQRVYAAQENLFKITDLIDTGITGFIGRRSLLPQLEKMAPVSTLKLR